VGIISDIYGPKLTSPEQRLVQTSNIKFNWNSFSSFEGETCLHADRQPRHYVLLLCTLCDGSMKRK